MNAPSRPPEGRARVPSGGSRQADGVGAGGEQPTGADGGVAGRSTRVAARHQAGRWLGMHLVLGLTGWALWFVAAYGGLSVACARLDDPQAADGAIRMALLALTVLAATAMLGMAHRCGRRSPSDDDAGGRDLLRLAAALYVVAAVATLGVGLPPLLLPACL